VEDRKLRENLEEHFLFLKTQIGLEINELQAKNIWGRKHKSGSLHLKLDFFSLCAHITTQGFFLAGNLTLISPRKALRNMWTLPYCLIL